ncbi:MAG: EamA family transporter [Nannocystaceae bacterium]
MPLAFATLYLVWGSTYLALRQLVAAAPAGISAGLRFATAGAILYVLARRRGAPRPSASQWRTAAVIGACMFTIGSGSVAYGQAAGVPSGTAALLIATVPLWMTVLGRLRGEGTPLSAWIGLLLGFGGVAWLVRPGAGLPAASLWLVLGAAAWAHGSLAYRRQRAPMGALMAAGTQMLAGGALLTIVGACAGELSTPSQLDGSAVVAWVYLVAVGSVVGFATYTWLLGRVAPAKVATYAYVNPVVALALGAAAGEPLTIDALAAMVLVLVAVAWTIRARDPTAAARTAPLPREPAAEP